MTGNKSVGVKSILETCGRVMIIVSVEYVDFVRCGQELGVCVNYVVRVRGSGVVRRIRDADRRGVCTAFIVDVYFVGVGRCFGVWGVRIAVDSKVGRSVVGNGFSLVLLCLEMRISEFKVSFACMFGGTWSSPCRGTKEAISAF